MDKLLAAPLDREWMTYSKCSKTERVDDLLKIQQDRERTYSKSSKTERGRIQNPAREREDVFKIQQERERERIDGCADERMNEESS